MNEAEPAMYSLYCTKKLIDRIQEPIAAPVLTPTTELGNWYATALFWRPLLVLAVNERTLLPVLMPLAPAATVAQRFPGQLAAVLAAHGIDQEFIEREVAAMAEVSFAKTASRSVVGMMNEFSFLAEGYREYLESFDLMTLTMRLAETPCKPIKYDSPARLIKEIVRHQVV